MRLEIENTQLKRQNAELKTQLMQLKKAQAQLPTKPYYRTIQIQKLCEKYPACKRWAAQSYQQDNVFLIKSIKPILKGKVSIPFIYSSSYEKATVLYIEFRSYENWTNLVSLDVAHDGKPLQ